MEILQNDEFYTINYRPEIKCTELIFYKKTTAEVLKKAYLQLLVFFATHKVERHITDTSNMGVVSVELQGWVSSEIVPQLIEASQGEKLILGLIMGNDVFSTFGAKNMAKKASSMSGDKLSINFFSNEVDALLWMNE